MKCEIESLERSFESRHINVYMTKEGKVFSNKAIAWLRVFDAKLTETESFFKIQNQVWEKVSIKFERICFTIKCYYKRQYLWFNLL